jgi:hypothetical protein
LRAACLFHAEKRTLALPGPKPLPVRWRHRCYLILELY